MANQEHLDILKQGADEWNQWRREHANIQPDLREADLSEESLIGDDLQRAKLIRTDLSLADLRGVDLSRANLSRANLSEADLRGANLSRANLSRAYLRGADLSSTSLEGANLTGANLSRAILVGTNLAGAILTQCSIYGISVWNVQLEGAIQDSLVITQRSEPTITVDNLEVAQFIYLMLNNARIRQVIETITSKVVLILGRFTPERKQVLDAIRNGLRKRDYLPVLFDFEIPASRDITETVSTLAHMARFVIADITDAKSIPQELTMIVPHLPSVPVKPLILNSQYEYGMFEHFTRFPWVLPVYRYKDKESLLNSLKESILDPAEDKAKELENLRSSI
jgi:Pentapeptide repeats (8 copies)